MKKFNVKILTCFFIVTAITLSAQSSTLKFNFASPSSKQISGYILINQNTIYSNKTKYGLLSNKTFSYNNSDKWTKFIPLVGSGIKSREKIEFKTKITQGDYYVEISMDGGNTGHWQGEIKINNKTIVNELYSFTTDPESDEPPNYWSFVRKIKIDSDQLLLSIIANNQESSISSLSLFPIKEYPLKLVKGKIIPTAKFFAPNSKLAIELINKGAVNEALRIIDAIPEALFGIEKANLLIAVAGRLETENPRQLIENANRILNNCKEKNNYSEITLKTTELYSFADQSFKSGGWDWTRDLTESGIFNHINFAGMAYEEIAQFENHPLQIRAMFELAKVSFWIWVEQHTQLQIEVADKYFKKVEEFYPDNKLLKMYMGERIQSVDYPVWDKTIPQWAYLQKKAMDGVLDIIHYWVENRQAENGEFGGKYDDDVEMLRWWPVARIVVDDSLALSGMQKLVDGIWNSKWIYKGWSRKLRDVEHSSEPIADTQPMMIGFDYGNPIYVERCMQTLDKIDLWTGITAKGHRHFKSAWYSSTAIDTSAPKNCDVGMNTRTVKAINWLAWYNQHPKAMKFLKEWGDAWLDDCMRTDKGKPRGIVPAAIRFSDDAISGYSDNWYNSGMFWHYYNFGSGKKILDQFLVNYLLFNDKKYLEPIELALELVQKYWEKDVSDAEPGSEKWTSNILRKSGGFADAVEIYRLITNNTKYDELIKKIGSDYIKYRLTKDEYFLKNGMKKIINGSYNNRELLTTEAYFTDRVEIRDLRTGEDWGATHLESTFTGSPVLETFFPFNLISWKGFGNNFAAIVTDAIPNRLKIKAINISDKTITGKIIFHQLEKGKYELIQTDKTSGNVLSRNQFKIIKRNSFVPLSLRSKDEEIIEINQLEKYEHSKKNLADLAITKSELKIVKIDSKKIAISIPVHNIGINNAGNFDVTLFEIINSGKRKIESKIIEELKAPLDLKPKINKVKFVVPNSSGKYEIIVDNNLSVDEITEVNNKFSFQTLKMKGIKYE